MGCNQPRGPVNYIWGGSETWNLTWKRSLFFWPRTWNRNTVSFGIEISVDRFLLEMKSGIFVPTWKRKFFDFNPPLSLPSALGSEGVVDRERRCLGHLKTKSRISFPELLGSSEFRFQ